MAAYLLCFLHRGPSTGGKGACGASKRCFLDLNGLRTALRSARKSLWKRFRENRFRDSILLKPQPG